MMDETEARIYRIAYDSAVKRYSKMTRAALAAEECAVMADQGRQRLWGGLGSRDELISSILELRGYTIAKWNESTHVIAHEEPWPDCPHCQAGQRANYIPMRDEASHTIVPTGTGWPVK